MQASLYLAPPVLPTITPPTRNSVKPRLLTRKCWFVKANATPVASDSSTVDYSSMASVFPAEACETLGGEACDVEMFPEVKLKPEPRSNRASTASELIDREYLDYNSSKTVFLEEACDDLGGEFCNPDYLRENQENNLSTTNI